ncbi:Alpha/Beta hydrolase protein [Xylariaceae sp. FL0804]|nr:Alpha/Beta hydrolase protein [Xylariaceae sp. FL0804]
MAPHKTSTGLNGGSGGGGDAGASAAVLPLQQQKTPGGGGPPRPRRPAPSQWLMGAEAFARRMPHHDGLAALWATKWRAPCERGVYPFHDGRLEDFAPVFADLALRGVDGGTDPAYTRALTAKAAELETRGDEVAAKEKMKKEGKKHEEGIEWVEKEDRGEASALYLRAACVLRIARFPYLATLPEPTDGPKAEAWAAQKRVYMKAAAGWREPVVDVAIPHRFRAAGDYTDTIPAYVRVPTSSRSRADDNSSPCPAVLLLTGLDGYRPDNTTRCDEFLARGWGVVVFEVPGTADCPADAADPTAPDRLMDSVLEWMRADGRFDMRRLLCWGLSAGGYYALRAAHTHAARLAGVVAQGAGCHHFFDPGWLVAAEGHEYPFDLLAPLARKHGFGGDVPRYLREAQGRFSLLENGVLDRPSCRLLLVNGTMDGLMPIEDSMLLFEYGSPKEARFFTGALHMGYPLANDSVYPWMEQVMASIK